MRVWLVTIGEPLPIEGGSPRLLRAGMLAQQLASQGHQVVWWSSTFSHSAKKHLVLEDQFREIESGLRLHLLHGPAYHRNVSFRRIVNHRVLGRKFTKYAPQFPRPDVILCSFPTIELSEAVVRFGKAHGVPTVLDVRDLWPDIFVDVAPQWAKPLARLCLDPLYRSTRRAFRGATAIVGISSTYLDWGLRYAERERQANDAIFPIGYHERPLSQGKRKSLQADLAAIGVNSSDTLFWFCGSFGQTYDLTTVIQAAKKLAERNIGNVAFVLSGDGERRAEYEALAKGSKNIFFNGWLDADGIRAMMSLASVGIAAYAPNAPQSLPNKIFEYLFAGIPILSSLRGESESLLSSHGCGMQYEAGDSLALMEKCAYLASHPEQRRQMGLASRNLYEAKFNMEQIHSRLERYLLSLSEQPAVTASSVLPQRASDGDSTRAELIENL